MNDKRVIVAISGGKASAWCAVWALQNYPNDEVVLYFNDTKWEHPDLYRYLTELEVFIKHPIYEDSDGRSVEELFIDNRALASNKMPFCSRILKAERLQRFYRDGDTIVFGIGPNEIHRAERIIGAYQRHAAKTKKFAQIELPLITENISNKKMTQDLIRIGIKLPVLYEMGFTHNNCSGGCVRAGKKQWKMLYEKLPAVYRERERVEERIRNLVGRDCHILKDETLRHFRERIEHGELPVRYYPETEMDDYECIGICDEVN